MPNSGNYSATQTRKIRELEGWIGQAKLSEGRSLEQKTEGAEEVSQVRCLWKEHSKQRQ